MQRLNGRCTQAFNFRHQRSGHLLQGRFKAILVQRDFHLLELTRYVVLNAVRVGTVGAAGQWPWSNYGSISGRSTAFPWLEVDWTLSQFGSRRPAARAAYRRFVSEGKGLPSPFRELAGQIYLGGEEFRKLMDARLGGQKIDPEIPSAQQKPWLVDIGAIKTAVAREYRVKEDELSRRRGGEDKMVAIYLARKLTNRTLAAIGEEFGERPSWAGQVTARIERESGGRLRRRLIQIQERLHA